MLNNALQLLLLIWQGITHPLVLGCILGGTIGCTVGFLAGRHGSSHLLDAVGKSLKTAARIVKYLALATLIVVLSLIVIWVNWRALSFGGAWIWSVWLCAAIGIGWTASLSRWRHGFRGKLQLSWLFWLVAAAIVALQSTLAIFIVVSAVTVFIDPMANTIPPAGWIVTCLMTGLLLPATEIIPLIFRRPRRLLRRWLWWRLLRRRLWSQRQGRAMGQQYFHPDPPKEK